MLIRKVQKTGKIDNVGKVRNIGVCLSIGVRRQLGSSGEVSLRQKQTVDLKFRGKTEAVYRHIDTGF